MANLFELAAKLTLDSSDYEKGIEAAKQAAANFSKGLSVVVTAVSNADEAVNNAADSAENLGESTAEAVRGTSDLVNAERNTANAVQAASDSMSDAADSAEGLSRAADQAADGVEAVEDSTSDASQKMSVFDKAIRAIAGGVDGLTTAGENVKKGFNTIHSAVDTVKSKFQSLTDAGKSLVDGGLNKVQTGVENVRSRFAPLSSAAQRLVGVFAKTTDAAEENADSMDESAKSSETLKNRLAMLQGTYDAAKAKVAQLTDEFNKSAKETGATSDETKALASELDKAEREMNDAEKALKQYANRADDAEKETRQLGDEEEKTAKKTSVFKDTLKALLSRDAIKAGLGALWNGVKRIGQAFIDVGKQAVQAYGEYEQLAGGAKKIFENMDFSQIEKDAKEAYKDLNMSASQYLEAINLAGSSFAQTMGDKKGYETARKGMKAIADYASGTGKNINELNQKYQMISRSASVYQSIADQFSGILPQTSADFLKQAQSAGFLEKKYKKLTEVPVAEYQEAVTKMIEKGVGSLGLIGNTVKESTETLTGSLAMTKAAWENLLVAIADENADFDGAIDNLVESATAAGQNLIPRVEQVIKGIGRAIEKLLPIALEEAPKAIARYAPEVLESVKSLFSVIYNSLQNLLTETDWNALGGKISDGINNIDWATLFSYWAQNFGAQLVATLNLLSGFIENVDWFELGQEIFYSIVAVVENIDWQSVVSSAFELLGAAIGGAGALIGGLSVAIKSVFDLVKAEVKSYFDEKIKEAGGNVVKGFFNGIIDAIANVGSWIYNNIFQPFINGFKSAFGIHSPSTVMMTMGKFIVEGLINPIKEIPGKVWNFFVLTVQKAIQFGNEMRSKAIEAARTFKDNIVNGLKSLPEKMGNIGKNIVTGLWNGINNAKDWVLGKIKGFTKSVLDGIKNFFGIHSPSTYTTEDGGFLVKGLVKGILDNAGEAEKAAEKLSDRVLKAFNSDGLTMSMNALPDLNADLTSSITAESEREESQTIALLTTILNAIYAIDDNIGGKIQKAIDNTDIRWNDRELGRLIKTYA